MYQWDISFLICCFVDETKRLVICFGSVNGKLFVVSVSNDGVDNKAGGTDPLLWSVPLGLQDHWLLNIGLYRLSQESAFKS